jgi:hypothetical protein
LYCWYKSPSFNQWPYLKTEPFRSVDVKAVFKPDGKGSKFELYLNNHQEEDKDYELFLTVEGLGALKKGYAGIVYDKTLSRRIIDFKVSSID